MFSCRAAWQRCGPLARKAAYGLSRDGEFPKAAFSRRPVRWLFCVYTICLTGTCGRVHSVPRSVSACMTSSNSQSIHVWRSDRRFWCVMLLAYPYDIHMIIFKSPGCVGSNQNINSKIQYFSMRPLSGFPVVIVFFLHPFFVYLLIFGMM